MPQCAISGLKRTKPRCAVPWHVGCWSNETFDMFKTLTSILRKVRAARPAGAEARNEEAPIFESLAMTDELRDALFPTTPRMVSAIFDRSVTQRTVGAPYSPPVPSAPPPDRGMMIL